MVTDPWALGAVDRFLAEGWAVAGIPGFPQDAAPQTLLRRVYFVLTGLQPTVAEQQDFVQRYAQAPEQVLQETVDRLMAAPQFGERWGRHWLDVVRYADTAGENTDRPLPHAWRFRNWVMQSLNRDLPFDHFTRMQLAGDLLAESHGQTKAEIGRAHV